MRILLPEAKLVRKADPELGLYRNAVVTPFARKGKIHSGAVYNADGRLVTLSQRPRVRHLKFVQEDPAVLPPGRRPERVAGRGCYIGHLMSHYGHLITEGISALWTQEIERCDFLLAHPFIWGRAIPGYMRDLFLRLGVDPDRLRLVDETLCVQELVVPERLWRMNQAVNGEFQRIIDKASPSERWREPSLKLYLSRSKLSRRAVSNEAAIEELFRGHGFMVIDPQEYSLQAQIELYGRTRVIAGLAGSALHNVIFCPPGAAAISIGDARVDVTPNQIVCGAFIRGATGAISFSPHPDGFDMTRLRAQLPDMLRDLSLG